MQGNFKFFKDDKFYGFVTGEDGRDYFFHGQELGTSDLRAGDAVEFEIEVRPRGPAALNVRRLANEARV